MISDEVLDTTPDTDPIEAERALGEQIDAMWTQRARRNFDASTSYLNSEIRSQWERDLAHFQNRHAPGSKFLGSEYKLRSKTFRPKVRLAARASEASTSAAMFSTMDLINATAENEDDPQQAAAAAAQKALLQYRLENTIPWFLTVMGSWQDCFVYGIAATYLEWQYDTEDSSVALTMDDGTAMVDEAGNPVMVKQSRPILDKPWMTMIPPENLRFDPGADWRDPVKTSPYLIRIVPMYLDEVKARMKKGGWRQLADETIKAAQSASPASDAIKRERERGRPMQTANSTGNPLVYVNQNFDRYEGVEVVYWTIGEHLLSEPIELEKYTILGERPIVIGRTIIESHKPYPTSNAGLGADLQIDSNEIANQRRDNVSLVLNKRYAIKRGKQIDFEALMRNVPGGGIVMDDPVGDLRVIETADVTASSYNEQDRLDNQFDEMQGTFSSSAVNSNRAVGETLGGINIANGAASAIQEYTLRVFSETWAEPVVRMLSKLICAYEDDEVALRVAGQNAKLRSKFGVDQITDDMLRANVTIKINLGNGATNPQQKISRLSAGIKTIGELPGVPERLNADEIIKEVMGALGYQNGSRFVNEASKEPPPIPPEIQLKQQELELRKQQLELDAKRLEFDAQFKQSQADRDAQMKMALAQRDSEQWMAELDLKRELGLADIASRENTTIKALSAKVGIEMQRDRTSREIKALDANMSANEMELKRSMGSGI